MFRNAEYVLALKDLLNLKGKVSLDDYKEAFEILENGSKHNAIKTYFEIRKF